MFPDESAWINWKNSNNNAFPRLIRCTIVALIVALCLSTPISDSASALSPSEYYSFSFNVQFSESQVTGTNSFAATVTADATCKKALPLSASQASITGRIVAEHQTGGTQVILNPSYYLLINPFPNSIWESTSIETTVPLQFPSGSASGNYTVTAELVEAKVKVLLAWPDVTSLLASEQVVGTIEYTSGSSGGTGGGGGGGGGGGALPIRVSTNGLTTGNILTVDSRGVVQDMIRLQVTAADAYLDIAEKTRILNANGKALTAITASLVTEPPEPPPETAIIIAVDFGPDGATFTPAITLAMSFNPDTLPKGMKVEDLYIAYWDGIGWQALPGTLDMGGKRLSVKISHFTKYSIMGKVSNS
ncbi:hypothetical protein ACFLVZ_02510 [Chloroflexota bacterium]